LHTRVGHAIRFPRENEEQLDPFTTSERQTIIRSAQHLNPDFATLLRVWAQTGMRAGEVCGLQQHDLDLNSGIVIVRRTWSRGQIGPTKTGRARTVSLLHPTLEETGEWQPGKTPGAWAAVEGIRGLRVRSLVPEAFVFTHGDGRPVPSMVLHREWRRVLAAAGVRYRPPEQLRHSFASEMLSRNAPLVYVQQQGGWRSAAVLLRVYARWLPSGLEPPIRQPDATLVQPEALTVAAGARR
jgi:integrase